MDRTFPSHRAPLARAAIASLAGLGFSLLATTASAQVGLSRWQLGDLPVTLVYPTAQAVQAVRLGPFELDVALDAAPAVGNGRLVVLSHGTGGSPMADHALAATLARAGFVVAQPLHAGDNHLDTRKAGPEAWQTRPVEVSRVIDGLGSHPTWGPLLKLDKVGVHGMSAGGVTALSLAGAQWRLLNLVRHCQAPADTDPGFCFNGLTTAEARAARQASYDRARGVPEQYLPEAVKAWHGGRPVAEAANNTEVRPDTRIAAVTLAVPVAAPFSAESLARIRVPVGVVSAGQDQMLQPRFHSRHVLQHCSACSLLADLKGAAHFDLLSPWPQAVAQEAATHFLDGGTTAPAFDGRERSAAWQAVAAFYTQQLTR